MLVLLDMHANSNSGTLWVLMVNIKAGIVAWVGAGVALVLLWFSFYYNL